MQNLINLTNELAFGRSASEKSAGQTKTFFFRQQQPSCVFSLRFRSSFASLSASQQPFWLLLILFMFVNSYLSFRSEYLRCNGTRAPILDRCRCVGPRRRVSI